MINPIDPKIAADLRELAHALDVVADRQKRDIKKLLEISYFDFHVPIWTDVNLEMIECAGRYRTTAWSAIIAYYDRHGAPDGCYSPDDDRKTKMKALRKRGLRIRRAALLWKD